MVKRKVSQADDDSTLLRNIRGIGPNTLCMLANCGFNFTPSSTVGDFKKQTKSFDALKTELDQRGIKGGYTLPKLRMLWSGGGAKGGNKKPKTTPDNKEEELVGNATITKDDVAENFLLPHDGPAVTEEDLDTGEAKENPELDALDRVPVPTKAVATGDVAAKVDVSVIPDQELTISPDDKNINGPTELLPFAPTPVIPGASLGEGLVSHSRHVTPQTLEEKQSSQFSDPTSLPSAKGNAEKDIGGDGFSSLIEEAKIGKDAPKDDMDDMDDDADDSAAGNPKRAFRSKQLSFAAPPTFNENDNQKPFDIRSASRHPFKQRSLFRDHDLAVKQSKLISETHEDRRRLHGADQLFNTMQDLSYHRYNPITEGYTFANIPPSESFRFREHLLSDYKLDPNPSTLRPVFPPCAYVNELLSGRFR